MAAEGTYLIIRNLQRIFVDIVTHIRITINRNMYVPINFTHELRKNGLRAESIHTRCVSTSHEEKSFFLVKMVSGLSI